MGCIEILIESWGLKRVPVVWQLPKREGLSDVAVVRASPT